MYSTVSQWVRPDSRPVNRSGAEHSYRGRVNRQRKTVAFSQSSFRSTYITMSSRHYTVLLNLDPDLRPPILCSQYPLRNTTPWRDFIDKRIDHLRAYYAGKKDSDASLAVNKLAKLKNVATEVKANASIRPPVEDEPLVRCCDPRVLDALQHDCRFCKSSFSRFGEHLTLVHELQRCSACCLDCLQGDCAQHNKEHMWEHLATHGRVFCTDCDVDMLTRLSISLHRVRYHDWVQCPVCNDAVPVAAGLDQHVCHSEAQTAKRTSSSIRSRSPPVAHVVSPDGVEQHPTNRYQAAPCQESNEISPESKRRDQLAK